MPAPINCCGTSCPDTELIEVPGVQGDPGADGADGTDGVNAYTTLTSDLTIPAIGSTSAAVDVADNSWMAIGQHVFASDETDVGTFTVATKVGTTSVTLTFVGAVGDSAPGNVINSGAIVSPAGVPMNQGIAGAGSPEAAVTASPGATYINTTDESFWVKKTGTNTNTGWIQLIASFILLMALLLTAHGQPIIRNSLTTNTEPASLAVVTNIAAAVSGASIGEAAACFNVSTGLVVTAAAAATNLITEWSYSDAGGAIGVETNANIVVTNAGTYIVALGGDLSGSNTDQIKLQVFTNDVFCPISQFSFTATATITGQSGFKQFIVDLPANTRISLRYGSQNASAISLGNACFVVHGVR